jgi:sulfite exporter TauE/SafE
MINDYVALFFTGLFGSAHCVGMCGPIVLAYSVHVQSSQKEHLIAAHLAYNLGRVATYTTLGFAAGLLGAVAAQLGSAQNALSVAAGLLMVLFGLTNLRIVPLFRLEGSSGGVMAAYRKGVGLLIKSPGLSSRLLLGVFNGFLPCGLVYAVLIKAAATRSPLTGAASMAAFGSGTITILFLLGFLSTHISNRVRQVGERIAAVLIVLMGLSLLLRGFGWYPL